MSDIYVQRTSKCRSNFRLKIIKTKITLIGDIYICVVIMTSIDLKLLQCRLLTIFNIGFFLHF